MQNLVQRYEEIEILMNYCWEYKLILFPETRDKI